MSPNYTENMRISAEANKAMGEIEIWMEEAKRDYPDVGEDDIFVEMVEAYILTSIEGHEDSPVAKEIRRRTGTERRDNLWR